MTASSLGVVAPSPPAVEFLDDSEVTPDEIELAADAAERCAAAQGVEVEATVTERPEGGVDVGYQVASVHELMVGRCFAENVRPLLSFGARLDEGIGPGKARGLALQER